MKSSLNKGREGVQEVYGGPEGDLWELVTGEHLEIGGMQSAVDLAKKAGIGVGMQGVHLLCLNGAGMRFLVRFKGVSAMHGVDPTPKMIERGLDRTEQEGLADRVTFTLGDPCNSGLPDGEADFVWGEGAWCYVEDKSALIAEAVRLVKPGGVVAFTDWIEGSKALTDSEAEHFLRFMMFPNILDLGGYRTLLDEAGCTVVTAENTGRFAPYIDLYLDLLNMQFCYDALKIFNFDTKKLKSWIDDLDFIEEMAHEGKLAQGLFVARKE